MPFLGSSMIDSLMALISVVVFSMGFLKIKQDDADERTGNRNSGSIVVLDDDDRLADSGYESIKEHRMSTPDADVRLIHDG